MTRAQALLRSILGSTLGSTAVALLVVAPAARAANGLSDERVSLPDGPGSIGGVGENVEVNANMGSAAFRVPIRVPQGATAAMTPTLELSYASGAGLGAAGIGWELHTPTIERMISKGLPEYDTGDLFAANGSEELVYVGDLDGSRVYRARFERGFVRYRWYDAGDGAAGHWTAEYPDGRVGYFGATRDGTLVPSARVTAGNGDTFRYHLVEMVDPVGRRLVQTYTKDNGWPLLDEVRYAFGGQSTPRFSVRFGYESRPDVISNATPGHVIRLAQRIREIRVLSEAQPIRTYELGYEDAAESGGISRLASVTEYGRDGGRTEIEHRFTYSRSLGGACELGCEQPFMVDMGTLPGGVNIQTGRASLIDINGDSMPDVVASDDLGNHTFHLSVLSAEGRPRFEGAGVPSTMGGTDLKFVLGAPSVQLLDVNGDGFTDIVDQQSASALCNFGTGDWKSERCVASPEQLPTLPDDTDDPPSDHDPAGMRFFDFDNDKRIDLLRTPGVDNAFVERNTGNGFETISIQAIGARFDEENLQLSDINGDGLQDPVMLSGSDPSSTLRYRLNLGRGAWGPFTDVIIPGLSTAESDNAVLEDLDGDGLADIVVVAGNVVSYWRNENDGRFAARVDITSDQVNGDIPERDENETVLFADMNGNGTDDVVWVRSDGNVRFLELFPVRPNLLSRIENGIGWVRIIEYGTSIAERARDEGTADAWQHRLPQSMVVVKATDTWVTLTASDDGSGIHDRVEMAYHDGFYDGAERAFRGFARVERLMASDPVADLQDPAREILVYDVGATDPYRAGLLLETSLLGGPNADVPIRQTRSAYADCPVAEVPTDVSPPVRHVCEVASTVVHQEGAPEAEWKTVVTERDHDGYGNVIEQRELGVVHGGPPEAPVACGACSGPDGLFSGACGATCEGDERVTSTIYVVPGDDTGGAWLLHLPVREATAASLDDEMSEVVTYYDGPDFEGLSEGRATRGLVTRVMRRTSATEFVPEVRNAYDALGNVRAALDPNGDPADATRHRRDYEYDPRGLRVTKVTIRAGDYDLVQEVAYEASFLLASEATSFFVVQDGVEKTPRNSSMFRYDEHGRITALIRPGDSAEAPTEQYVYELADPVSRVITRGRRTPGGSIDVEIIQCMDGRARTVQTRQKLGGGEYFVSGFSELNSKNQVVRVFEPYTSPSAECDTAPPPGTRFTSHRYDADDRMIETLHPDAEMYGTSSVTRVVYGPLSLEEHDEEDSDPQSPHASTPLRAELDGLSRKIRYERLLTPETVASYRLAYDARGNLASVLDPGGNAQEQTFDLAGRVLEVIDPDTGSTTYEYDAAGLVIRQTDARGVTRENRYDALNRLVETWDAADREGTLDELVYDYDAACSSCRNGAGQMVGMRYPLPTGRGADAIGYDPRGNLVLRQRTLEGTTFETTYNYDGVGALAGVTYPDGRMVAYEYDEGARVIAVPGILDSVTYEERGMVASITHANGVTRTMEYDAMRRPSRLAFSLPSGGDFYDVRYTRDRVGSVLEAESFGSGLSHAARFEYDSWYRPLSATVGEDEEELRVEYDLLDRILSRTSSLGAESKAHVGSYAYDASPNTVTAAGELVYAYDEAGNATRRGGLSLTWDFQGRITAAEPNGVDAAEVARFGYAPNGERVMKLEDGGVTYYPAPDFVVRDGISTAYVTVDGLRVAKQKSDVLATATLPDTDGDEVIDIADAVGGIEALEGRYLRAAARRLLYQATDTTLHVHTDGLGSLVAVTDEEGNLVAERVFHPFGEERAATGFVDELGFTGQELDESTGLVHFEHRYLDTTSGRWASSDPAFAILSGENVETFGESTTGYAYVANNPVNVIDPDGLQGQPAWRAHDKMRAQARMPVKKQKRTAKQVLRKAIDTAALVPGVGSVVALGKVAKTLIGSKKYKNTTFRQRLVGLGAMGKAFDKRRQLKRDGGAAVPLSHQFERELQKSETRYARTGSKGLRSKVRVIAESIWQITQHTARASVPNQSALVHETYFKRR